MNWQPEEIGRLTVLIEAGMSDSGAGRELGRSTKAVQVQRLALCIGPRRGPGPRARSARGPWMKAVNTSVHNNGTR